MNLFLLISVFMTPFLQMRCTCSVPQDICQAAVHKALTKSGIPIVTQLKKFFVFWTKAVSPSSYLYSETRLIDDKRRQLQVSPGYKNSADHRFSDVFPVPLEQGFTREF